MLTSRDLAARAVEILPAVALLHHRLEVFLPNHPGLDGALADRADEPRRDVVRAKRPVAEVPRERQPAVDDRDRLGRAQRPARRLQFALSVRRHALAKLAEDRDDAADLFDAGRL